VIILFEITKTRNLTCSITPLGNLLQIIFHQSPDETLSVESVTYQKFFSDITEYFWFNLKGASLKNHPQPMKLTSS